MNLIKHFGLLIGLGLVLTLFSCEKKDEKKAIAEFQITPISKPTTLSHWFAADLTDSVSVNVVDTSNRPISGARILIGSFQGHPFKNNYLTTDENGQVVIPRDEWSTPAHVTADASGFIRQSLLNQKPGNIVIKMNRSHLRQKAKITGVVNGLPVANGDKNIDFGLVMNSLTKVDLFNFDVSNVISPYTDVLSAMGQEFDVPSNVSIPNQKERYIVNITLDKPVYSIYSSTLGTKRLFSTAGRFVFKPVVDELRDGKPFYELINYFNLSGGTLREVNLVSNETQLNFPAQELMFTRKVSVRSPKINSDEVFLSLTANEVAGQLVPTGVRKLNSEETAELTAIENAPLYLVNAIKRQSEFMGNVPGGDRITASMLPFKIGLDPQLLPLIANPTIDTTNGYIVKIPKISAPAKMTRLAVSAAVSDIFTETVGNKKITSLVKRWEVLGTDWPDQVALPNWPLDSQIQAHPRRFEINLIGGLDSKTFELGDDLVHSATHVTRSSVDFN